MGDQIEPKSAAERLAVLDRQIAELVQEDETLKRELARVGRELPWWAQPSLPATLFLVVLGLDILLFAVGRSYRSSVLFMTYLGTPLFIWLVLTTTRQPNWKNWTAQHSILERLAPLYQERNELLERLEGEDHEDIEPFTDHPEITEAAENCKEAAGGGKR